MAKDKPLEDLDYVKLYANKLKENNALFKQQKKLIESQLKSSSDLFKRMFGLDNFEINARKYLKGRKLIH